MRLFVVNRDTAAWTNERELLQACGRKARSGVRSTTKPSVQTFDSITGRLDTLDAAIKYHVYWRTGSHSRLR